MDDIRKTIKEMESDISYYCRLYREHREQLSQLDEHIMSLYKAKWSLERKLIPVTKLPTYIGKTAKRKKKEEEVIVDYENLTIDQLSKLLDECQTIRNSGNVCRDSGFSDDDFDEFDYEDDE